MMTRSQNVVKPEGFDRDYQLQCCIEKYQLPHPTPPHPPTKTKQNKKQTDDRSDAGVLTVEVKRVCFYYSFF